MTGIKQVLLLGGALPTTCGGPLHGLIWWCLVDQPVNLKQPGPGTIKHGARDGQITGNRQIKERMQTEMHKTLIRNIQRKICFDLLLY